MQGKLVTPFRLFIFKVFFFIHGEILKYTYQFYFFPCHYDVHGV